MTTGTEAKAWVGLDVGGTNIQGVLVEGGRVAARSTVATPAEEGAEVAVSSLVGLVRELEVAAGRSCAGVGVGFPGVVFRETGSTGFLPNLPAWSDAPIGSDLSASLSVPCHLLNDARMATLGELHHGVGTRFERPPTLLLLTLGTGIGGGVVVDGRLRLGALGAAGELGHQLADPEGLPCGCGARGCVETLATGPALVAEGVRLLLSHQAPELARLTGGDPSAVSPSLMGRASDRDPSVARAIERAGEALGIAIANGIVALHPEIVVLCGGLSALGELLLGPIRATVERRVRVFPADDVEIVVSELGNLAGALGGAALAERQGAP